MKTDAAYDGGVGWTRLRSGLITHGWYAGVYEGTLNVENMQMGRKNLNWGCCTSQGKADPSIQRRILRCDWLSVGLWGGKELY
jgi:hypothetical protein